MKYSFEKVGPVKNGDIVIYTYNMNDIEREQGTEISKKNIVRHYISVVTDANCSDIDDQPHSGCDVLYKKDKPQPFYLLENSSLKKIVSKGKDVPWEQWFDILEKNKGIF